MIKRCGNCGSEYGKCPECGAGYAHGNGARCVRMECKAVNAPIDCTCGLVVSENRDGVLDQNMNLIPWR